MQEKEAMEAAIRAFEDWEFSVLEQESGIDDEDEGTAEEKHEGSELETELSSQQHVVNTAQVNNTKVVDFFFSCLSQQKFSWSCFYSSFWNLRQSLCCCPPCVGC